MRSKCKKSRKEKPSFCVLKSKYTVMCLCELYVWENLNGKAKHNKKNIENINYDD